MIHFQRISKIFSNFLDNTLLSPLDKLENLVRSIIETNKRLWNLEDSARMIELGAEHVAAAKQEIDKTNQVRNNTIREIDLELENQMQIVPLDSQEQFYGETPGMIIDRLSILHIKHSEIEKLLAVIEEEDLKKEYEDKEQIISKQINDLGGFLDLYFNRLRNKEVFFEVRQPVKIYNDNRVRKYIKLLADSKSK